MSRNFEKESKKFTVRRLELTDFDQFSELFEEVDRLHREALPEYFKKPETQKYFLSGCLTQIR
jgi:hypothetical protein